MKMKQKLMDVEQFVNSLKEVVQEYEYAIYTPENYSQEQIIALYNKATLAVKILNDMEEAE